MDKVFNSVEKKTDMTEEWIAKVETLEAEVASLKSS